LIDDGIKVAFVYGDRDYACNWFGGEAVSLAVNYSHTSDFAAAGYTNISTNSSYVGGLVRQFGNFSFSRVFQAGHEVPAYQPETAYEIFRRALFNLDIATGEQDTANNATFATTGLADTFSIKDVAPESPEPICYSYAAISTCTDDQLATIVDGSALIKDYILLDHYTSTLFPDLASAANSTSGSGSNGTSGGSGGGSSGTKNAGTATVVFNGIWILIAMTVVSNLS